jgi:ABC-type transport system involved in multi-copper enzyme maturation permease subunit
MFAALVIERPRLTWDDYLQWPLVSAKLGFGEYWVQWAGGFAAFGLLLWLLAGGYRRLFAPTGNQTLARKLFVVAVCVAGVAYAPFFALLLFKWLVWLFVAIGWCFRALLFRAPDAQAPAWPVIEARPLVLFGRVVAPDWHRLSFSIGGFAALVAVLLPLLTHLTELSWRRIWALSRLTVKEVIRRRVLWVFAALALVFLFGAWFIIDPNPEHRVSIYVELVYLAMAVLLLATGSLLAAFSLPTDIRQQTIHTILTKPVQRMEIVLGRFLGFMAVLTAAVLVMGAVSLGYVLYTLRGVDQENFRARVPLTGFLEFEGADDIRKGTNVGEEWDYRGYISGKTPFKALQYAKWSLRDLTPDLGRRPAVRCEFTFSIYRTVKDLAAQEGKGIPCTFFLTTAFCPLTRSDAEQPWVPMRLLEIQAERDRLRRQSPPLSPEQIDDQIAEQFGVYEHKRKPVKNFHTQSFDVPGGLFRNQLRGTEELKARLAQLQGKELSQADREEAIELERALRGARSPLLVRARCESSTQFLGMAQYDLYMLAAEQPFALNFFKGAVGLWFWLCLVVGVAIACSTHLSGVITWVCVGFLFLVGLFKEWLATVAEGKNEGGGPMESMLRLFGRTTPVAPLEDTTVKSMAVFSDEIFRWFMKLFQAVLPSVDRYDFSGLVASGFNVSASDLLLTAIYLAGYLLPWLVLAYYLVRSREVATW